MELNPIKHSNFSPQIKKKPVLILSHSYFFFYIESCIWKICNWNSKTIDNYQNYWAKLNKAAANVKSSAVNKTKKLILNKINQKINLKTHKNINILTNQNQKLNQKPRNKPYELVELLNYMYRY